MSAQYIMGRAAIRTGLSDWGDPEFLPRLTLFMASIRSDTGLTDAGRENLEATALRFAEGRLRLEKLVASHPEIRRIAIPRPIIVTGIPRSGTTALVTALAEHPQLQSLRYQDVAAPFAAHGRADTRQAEAIDQAMPGIGRLHDMAPGAKADDAELQGLAFAGYGLEWLCHAPKWRDRYLADDQRPAYRYLKLAMQALTFLRGGDGRWIIKNPQHMEQLQAVKAVFPDALIAAARRDPAARLRSMEKVMDAFAPCLRTRAIPISYWRARFAVMQARYESGRHLFPDRVELDEWTAQQAQQLIWPAANLQPDTIAA
jgi:hypothetical protein